MSVWLAKGAILAAMAAMLAIRAPHGRRSRATEVASSRKGTLEKVLLTIASIGCFLPLLWVVSPAFAFAEYSLHSIPFFAGCLCLAASLWLFHRSHTDLGTNWSPTLEVRSGHRLITHGVYQHIRHPMYASLLLYSIGQTLAVPNWIAGPSFLAAFAGLFALRVAAEERMMRDQFGDEYTRYVRRTRRLVPGVW